MFKVPLSIAAFCISFLAPHDASASVAAKLTSIAAKRSPSGVNIDLTFDRPFIAKALKPSFERNFVQVALHPARLDAAKVMPISESEIAKVFAYPYNLDVTRIRIILKHENSWAKGRVSLWNSNPRSVRIFVKEPLVVNAVKPVVEREMASEPPKPVQVQKPEPSQPAAASAEEKKEEKKLIAEVVNNTRDIDINNPDSVKAALAAGVPSAVDKSGVPATGSAVQSKERTSEPGPIGITADPSRHFARMAAALFGVLALFVGLAFGVKKYAAKIKRLPFGRKERLIQVVASHYLGNKKSISLVKITGEYMVVGVSNDGISLISKLGPEVNIDKYLEDRFWGGTFEKHLDHYAHDNKVVKEIDLSGEEMTSKKHLYDGVRDLADGVKDRVRLGPSAADSPQAVPAQSSSLVRASIKEKLTKLKPLS